MIMMIDATDAVTIDLLWAGRNVRRFASLGVEFSSLR